MERGWCFLSPKPRQGISLTPTSKPVPVRTSKPGNCHANTSLPFEFSVTLKSSKETSNARKQCNGQPINRIDRPTTRVKYTSAGTSNGYFMTSVRESKNPNRRMGGPGSRYPTWSMRPRPRCTLDSQVDGRVLTSKDAGNVSSLIVLPTTTPSADTWVAKS